MKITAVNFADVSFSTQQKYSSWSLRNIGKVDDIISYTPKDIKEYIESYPEFKKYYYKGYGNYFWKPYIIQKALEEVEENDFLIYMDSGTFILKNLSPLFNYLNKIGKDILVFESALIAKQWTKKDTFILMQADSSKYHNVCQLLAGYIVIKKTKKSLDFIEKYRSFCSDERIISDKKNVMGLPNDDSYKEHRHDQSVLTILAHQNKSLVQIEKDLSDYGVFPEQYFKNSDRLYDKSALDKDKYKFKGYILSNRKAHPLWYGLKYFTKKIKKQVGL